MTPKTTTQALHARHADHVQYFPHQDQDMWDPLQALLHFNIQPAAPKIPAADLERLHQVKAFLREHYLQADLSLAMLCRKFGLNEFKLKKGFKQLFHCTVFSYVQELKMRTARQLLVAGKMNVNEIADHLNYSSPNHFSTAFRNMYGYPPRALRAFTFNFFAPAPKQSRPE
ncbi:helix-turn-helix transcriptional regulator [Chitinophaga cymbidii]|nr:AraC family transcriptional regulator [Chitinophaga cymbidii]